MTHPPLGNIIRSFVDFVTLVFFFPLMQPEGLDDHITSPDDAGKPGDQLSAVGGGVVGELDAIAPVALENLQGEAVVP
jgi:hypothetical protein